MELMSKYLYLIWKVQTLQVKLLQPKVELAQTVRRCTNTQTNLHRGAHHM